MFLDLHTISNNMFMIYSVENIDNVQAAALVTPHWRDHTDLRKNHA
uniref:Uncharacterized protein n=1 Tax=Arundo donax TaxID=35708 RepID=A0A0A9GMS1_ARUDO